MKTLVPILMTLIVCATALAGAWLWMTPYRYELGGAIRIHRLTGKSETINRERLDGEGTGPAWLPLDETKAPAQSKATRRSRVPTTWDEIPDTSAKGALDRFEAHERQQAAEAAAAEEDPDLADALAFKRKRQRQRGQ